MPKKAVAKKKPAKKKAPTKRRSTKQMEGEGFMDFLKGANKFLKDTHLVSGIAGALSAIPGLNAIAAPVAGISGSLGYGKKKRARGRGAKVGAGLNLPGRGQGRLVQVPVVHMYR